MIYHEEWDSCDVTTDMWYACDAPMVGAIEALQGMDVVFQPLLNQRDCLLSVQFLSTLT